MSKISGNVQSFRISLEKAILVNKVRNQELMVDRPAKVNTVRQSGPQTYAHAA